MSHLTRFLRMQHMSLQGGLGVLVVVLLDGWRQWEQGI